MAGIAADRLSLYLAMQLCLLEARLVCRWPAKSAGDQNSLQVAALAWGGWNGLQVTGLVCIWSFM